ncbi:MAG: amidohydrolase family protein [Gemmatimonadales bacterium]
MTRRPLLHRLLPASLGLALAACAPAADRDEALDLVLANGRVMDPESGLDATRNVGIKDGKIAAISEGRLTGARVIDVGGRVIAPGFIDLHSHGHNALIGGRVQAFDGVTTSLEAEAGQLPIDAAYRRAAEEGRAINYGFTASWLAARIAVMGGVEPDGSFDGFKKLLAAPGWADVEATDEQVDRILERVDAGLAQGAIGIGFLLGYAAGTTNAEVRRVSELAAERQVVTFVHTRSTVPADSANEEVIAAAQATGARWHLCHASASDRRQLVQRLIEARSEGAKLTAEVVTSNGGSTFIDAVFLRPENWERAGGRPDWIIYYGRRLGSFEELGRVQRDDPSAMVVIDPLGRPTDDTDPERRALMADLIKSDWAIASDAMPWSDSTGNPLPVETWPLPETAWAHARSASNFTRAIQKYAMEWQLVSLMDVIRAAALHPALVLEETVPQLKNKGRVKLGADADLIVFDPAQVRFNATQERPAQISTGMEYVLVNGTLLIDQGRLDPTAHPGQPIRR